MQSQITATEKKQLLIGLNREQLDHLPWAVAKLNRNGVLTYGNHKMCAIAGVQTIEGRSIKELFRGKALEDVARHLESRFSAGIADEYAVTLTRPEDGVDVPIFISAMPEFNEEGETVEVIAFVRDVLTADVSEHLHKAIENLRDSRQLLDAVTRECQRVVPSDISGVSIYSEDGEHTRSLYIYPSGGFRSSARWYPMTAYAKKFIESKEVSNEPDLEEFFNRPEWAAYRNDPDVVQIMKMGVHSSLSIRVVSGGRVVASLGFGRKKEKGPFTQDEQDKLCSLPLEAALRMVLHLEQTREMEFTLGLMRQIAASENIEDILRVLTKQIALQYDFDNVSAWEVDEEAGQLRLRTQYAEREAAHMPEGYSHGIDKGVTGYVCRTGETLNVADVTEPKYKNIYVPVYAAARSELCIPISVGQRTRFLLNLEDARKNAFATEEQQALEHIAQEARLVLALMSKTQVFSELLKHSNDAIIQTDVLGIIKDVNPATEQLLGYKAQEMAGTPLQHYFENKEQGHLVQKAKSVRNDEFALQHKNGSPVPLLISGTSLPPYMALKVYVCNDISSRKRMAAIATLGHMYNEIAAQIKTPLSLAFIWLTKLQEIETRPEVADMIAKTIKQLNKVEMTNARLQHYERHQGLAPVEKTLFDIPLLLEDIKREIPDSEADHIELTVASDVPPVHADLFELWFCLGSIITFLLRFVSQSGKVSVDISAPSGRVVVAVKGHAPPITGGEIAQYADAVWAARAIAGLALGEETIRTFIETNHQGAFRTSRGAGDLVEFTIELPQS